MNGLSFIGAYLMMYSQPGKFITILRHPCDVVLSAQGYWGREELQIWRGIATMSRCILHKASKITYAVKF